MIWSLALYRACDSEVAEKMLLKAIFWNMYLFSILFGSDILYSPSSQMDVGSLERFRNLLGEDTLFIEPDSLVVDLYYGKDTLIYGFFNPSDYKTITITAKVSEDIQNVFSK